MKHFDFTTVKHQHAAAQKRLAEVSAEIAQIDSQYGNNPRTERHAEQLRQPLLQERQQLRELIDDIERSHAWEMHREYDKRAARDAHEQTLLQKQREHGERQLAERRAYEAQVNQIDWTLTNVPERARGEIAREHIAQLQKQQDRARLLNDPDGDEIIKQIAAQEHVSPDAIRNAMKPQPFETHAVDRETGKRYVIVTDADGTTYAAPDLSDGGESDGAA